MAHPSARVTVVSKTKQSARLKLYGHGEDDRVANEGDLLIVSETYIRDANNHQDIDFELIIRGDCMFAMLAKVQAAFELYEANKDYLKQPATRIVSRSLPHQVIAQQLDAIRSHG